MKQIVITSWLFLLIALAVILIATAACVLRNRPCRRIIAREKIRNGLFWFYVCIIISFTLLPVSYPAAINFEPEFNLNVLSLLNVFRSRAALITNAQNVILFMPLTILGYLTGYKVMKNASSAFVVSLIFSLIIEVMQGAECVFHLVEDFVPVVDINDVICNTLGGILGYVVIWFYKKEHLITENEEGAEEQI